MGDYAAMPDPKAIPPMMALVGWRCVADGHDCLVPLSAYGPSEADSDGLIPMPNHHGHWIPVYALVDDLEDPGVWTRIDSDRKADVRHHSPD